MAKHVWTIINLNNQVVSGTNDFEVVDKLVEDDNFICIHSEGSYFKGTRDPIDIPTIIQEDEDEVEDEDEDEDEED